MTATGHNTGRPLVTFALFAYNQERFIREAVEGAFSQDYSPLQIILSDDCSSDRTFEIMQEMAAAYDGPHTIVLNRNTTNLGIAGHIRKLAQIAKGDIIVMAAGDDVSAACRVARIVLEFKRDNRHYAILSGYITMDAGGRELEVVASKRIGAYDTSVYGLARNGGGVGSGATYAYRREVMFWPSEYPDSCVAEDRLLPFRAALLGKVVHIREPLVRYRLLKSSVSRNSSYTLAQLLPDHIDTLLSYTAMARAEGLMSVAQAARVNRVLVRAARLTRIQIALLQHGGMVNRLLSRLIFHASNYRTIWRRVAARFGGSMRPPASKVCGTVRVK